MDWFLYHRDLRHKRTKRSEKVNAHMDFRNLLECLKLVRNFYQIFISHQMIAIQKL